MSIQVPRLYLSPPHMSGHEQRYIKEAFDTNWIAPLGPNVESFESEFSAAVGAKHALALSSGTAALHLALNVLGVGAGDEVLVSTFTFCASVNPILYSGAKPVFIDSETHSWNMDPALLASALDQMAQRGRTPKAVIVVHLYGQSADMTLLLEACARHGVPLIEDAAEALGATYNGRPAGSFGVASAFSFNGNKIITTSGGGMLVTNGQDVDGALIAHARKLATQARDAAPHYQHSEIGYNYRMSNVLAGIGRGQLEVLNERVAARRKNFDYYKMALDNLPGIGFMPEPAWSCGSRWLTCITIDPVQFGADREQIRLALDAQNIEARPLWKPMHMQPAYDEYPCVDRGVASGLFSKGLCLPSGSNLSHQDLDRVISVIKACGR
jgi:dTDP-4-amino-4,6-dideoxygalactose transaminase